MKRKKPSTPVKHRFSTLFSFITGLTIGLFIAVVVYFYDHNIPIERINPLLVTTSEAKKANKHDSIARLPDRQFDFYQILPNKEVNISEWETIEEETATSSPDKSQSPTVFILQVGAFKEYNAADEIKAKLAFVGISANIQRVVINGQDVRYRVRVGPYKDKAKLQQASARLRKNNFDFMQLQLRASEV